MGEKNDNNDNCKDGMEKNASGRTGSSSVTKAEEENGSGSLEYLAIIEKPLNPAPESADVQEDKIQDVLSMKDEEKQLASTSIDGQDQNEAEKSPMKIDPNDASTPKLFRYCVQSKWVEDSSASSRQDYPKRTHMRRRKPL